MTLEERTVEMLNRLLQRKMNSLAAYLAEASPYVAEGDEPIVEAIKALHETERRHAAEAARLILSLEGVPQIGSFDPDVAESNYLSVRYLLGPLLARLESDIALFQQLHNQCELPAVREFLARAVAEDLAHRDRLKAHLT